MRVESGRRHSLLRAPLRDCRPGRAVATALAGLLLVSSPAGAAFTEAAAAWGIAAGDSMSYAASFADVDGDGDPDLYVNHHWKGPADLYRNEGGTHFLERSELYGTGNSDRHDAIWADLDNDGDPDQYVLHGRGQDNELFRNLGRWQFEEVAEAAGLENHWGRGREMSIADFDGDGDLDIYVVNDVYSPTPRPSELFWNDGNGTFTADPADVSLFEPRWHCAAADFDGDGVVDIVTTLPPATPGELWRGNGDGTWTDVASSAFPGIGEPLREGQALAWADYDDDGDLDLFVGAGNRGIWDWAGREADSLRFYAEADPGQLKAAILTTDGDSLTIDVADNQYQPVTAFFGGAGDSVRSFPATFSVAELAGIPPALAGPGEGVFLWSVPGGANDTVHVVVGAPGSEPLIAGGTVRTTGSGVLDAWTDGYDSPPPYSTNDWTNRLYRNEGDGTFVEVTSTAFAVGDSTANTKSAAWADYDNDGDLDLHVSDGGTVATGNQPNRLYRNEGDGTFTETAAAEGVAGSPRGMTDGAAWADVNGDGFLDLFVDHGAEHPPFGVGPRELFLNSPNGNHWLELDLRGLASNGSGIGARMRFRSASGIRWRTRLGESVNCFAGAATAHVGLGADTVVDTLQIFWPSGIVDTHAGVAADGRWLAVEGGTLRPATAAGLTLGWSALADTLAANAAASHALPVDNPAGLACDYVARAVDEAGAPVDWIAVTPDSSAVWPGGTDPLAVRLDATGLAAGLHTGRVIFTSNSAGSPDTISVTLQVLPPAVGAPAATDPPTGLSLSPARPNPTRGDATFVIALPVPSDLDLAVFDVRGRRVATLATGDRPAGRHTIRWNRRDSAGRRVGAGLYLVRLTTADGDRVRRIVVLD